MENLEIRGKTVDEAIQRALEQLGVSREEVKVTVLKESKAGIFGLGAEEAVIRVEPLEPALKQEISIADTVKGILETLLNLMEVDCSVEPYAQPPVVQEGAAVPIAFDIKGRDLGILIGRRGQTLAYLQFIVRLMIGHRVKVWQPIIIDVEGYKQRLYEGLKTLAWHVAEQVKVTGEPFTLEPMPAYERRIIHLALADHPDVTTQSIGEGEARKVVIAPKGK